MRVRQRVAAIVTMLLLCGGTASAGSKHAFDDSGNVSARGAELHSPESQRSGKQTRPQVLTLERAVETVRPMTDHDSNSIFVSPDAQRYVIVLVRGDVQRNGLWAEVLSGELTSWQTVKPRSVARLFTSGLGGNAVGEADATQLTLPGSNPPRWIDKDHVVLFWPDEKGVKQLVSINASTGDVQYLTHDRYDVVNFGLSERGDVLYGARATGLEDIRSRSDALAQSGFAVRSPVAAPLVLGVLDGTPLFELTDCYKRFVVSPRGSQTREIAVVNGGKNRRASVFEPVFSPDGRHALVDGAPLQVAPEWGQYTDSHFQQMMQDFSGNPDGGYANQFLQPFIVDLARAEAAPLWNVPMNGRRFAVAAWSPQGASIVIGPTFLPVDTAGSIGLAGLAVAEVDLVSREFRSVPIRLDSKYTLSSGRWLSATELRIDRTDGTTQHFRKTNGAWIEVTESITAPTPSAARFQLKWDQSANDVPVLVAVATRTGLQRTILDPNEELRASIELGKVEFVEWRDPDGQLARGRFYYPVGYQRGQRSPLVVQTHGMAAEGEFSLYGPGNTYGALGPSGAMHLAQVLAGRGIAVLQMDDRRRLPPSVLVETPGEAEFYMRRFEAAIKTLADHGLVDPSRVGLMGHSRTGWYVEYALTHSEFPYAAAVASDNIDASYLQSTMWGWTQSLNGASAFGEGMAAWLVNSPAFNAERVRTPLQLQVMSSFSGMAEPVMLHWEMYSRLKHLQLPVELYVVPDLLRGAHALQNPKQLLGLQERTLDWWCFWLLGQQDESESKHDQYREWQRLKEQQQASLKRPRPARLAWKVVAHEERDDGTGDSVEGSANVSVRSAHLSQDEWVAAQNSSTLRVLSHDVRYAAAYREALDIHRSRSNLAGDYRNSDMLRDGFLYHVRQDDAHPRGVWERTDLISLKSGNPNWQSLIDLDALSHKEGKAYTLVLSPWANLRAAQCFGKRCMIGLGNGSDKQVSYREFDLDSVRFVEGFELPDARGSAAVWVDADTLLIVMGDAGLDANSGTTIVRRWRRGQPLEAAKEVIRGDAASPFVRILGFDTGDGQRTIVFLKSGANRRTYWQLSATGSVEPMTLPAQADLVGRHDDEWIIHLIRGNWSSGADTWPEGSLLSINAREATSSAPKIRLLLQPGEDEIVHLAGVTRRGVVATTFDRVRGRLWIFSAGKNDEWRKRRVSLPDMGATYIGAVDPASDVAIVSYENYLSPTVVYALDAGTGALDRIGAAPNDFAADRYEVDQIVAVSKDGTRVPYFFVRRRDFRAMAGTPTILHAYGGAGPEWPEYSGTLGKLWLDRGGAYVFASVRGGGDLGPQWRLWGADRQRTYEDFIAVAEDLVKRRITSAAHLGIRGHSNGGLLVGVTLNLRPDLFNAAVLENPVLDQLDERRPFTLAMPGDSGALTFVQQTSPYQNLKFQEFFPAPLVTTNSNDVEVLPDWARNYVRKLEQLGLGYLYFEMPEGNHRPHGSTPEQAALHDALVYTYFATRLR